MIELEAEWETHCEFICDSMQFYSYPDFLANAKKIRFAFDRMTTNGKKMYMWYINARPLAKHKKKVMWDYLVHRIELQDVLTLQDQKK